jgi:hypothetical protein
MQCFFKPATEDEPSAAHSAYKAPQKVAEPKGNFSTPVNKRGRGRRKGDERNTGRETNQSREKKMAAEGLHFADTTPQRTQETKFEPDTSGISPALGGGMYPCPGCHHRWPSTAQPKPRPSERRAQQKMDDAESVLEDAMELVGAATTVFNASRHCGDDCRSACDIECGTCALPDSKRNTPSGEVEVDDLVMRLAMHMPSSWFSNHQLLQPRPLTEASTVVDNAVGNEINRRLKSRIQVLEWQLLQEKGLRKGTEKELNEVQAQLLKAKEELAKV